MSSVFLYLLIVHFIADYYLQNENLANEKKTKYKYILKHSFIYAICSFVFLIPIWSSTLIIYFMSFSIAHFFIDTLKFYIVNKYIDFANEHEVPIYLIDQAMHICTIFIISQLIYDYNVIVELLPLLSKFEPEYNRLLRPILVLLLIFKPVNITFKITYSHIKNSISSGNLSDETTESPGQVISVMTDGESVASSDEEKELNVGKLIGNLERLLVLILLSVNEYSAIGLIFAAKSITRYNQIASNKRFAEYYLLGTLYSILATLIIYQSVFVWI